MFEITKLNSHNRLFKRIPDVSDYDLKRFADPVWFEIRGTNGSGKSTVPFIMQETDPRACVFKSSYLDAENKKIEIYVTGCPSFRTLIVGSYPVGRAVGGVDTISGSEKIEETLLLAKRIIKQNPEYERVMFEGIMTSTSNKRWSQYLLDVIGVPPSNCYVGWCNTPLEVCIERVRQRSGKPFNESLVEGKFDQLSNQLRVHAELFPEIHRVVYDCMCSKDEMLTNWKRFNFKWIAL